MQTTSQTVITLVRTSKATHRRSENATGLSFRTACNATQTAIRNARLVRGSTDDVTCANCAE